MRRTICVIVASRANYGRIKTVLSAIDEHPSLELKIILEASALLYSYGDIEKIMEAEGFEISAKSYNIIAGENLVTMAKSTGLAVMELSNIFDTIKPDVVLTVADRFETLATAVAASYMNIPVAHTQGGELTGSIDESVRHAITKLSHIHFPANQDAADIVVQMGEDPSKVFVTGCPAIDVVRQAIDGPEVDLFQKYGGTGDKLNWCEPFIVVLQHPVTTEYGSGMSFISSTINAVTKVGIQTVWLWPNIDAGSADIAKAMRSLQARKRDFPMHFYRNFSPEDYVHLLNKTSCLVGNSSSGIREGAILGTPVVNIGTRQSNRSRGINVIDADYDEDAIYKAIKTHLKHGRYTSDPIYGDGRSAQRIAAILATCDLKIEKEFRRVGKKSTIGE